MQRLLTIIATDKPNGPDTLVAVQVKFWFKFIQQVMLAADPPETLLADDLTIQTLHFQEPYEGGNWLVEVIITPATDSVNLSYALALINLETGNRQITEFV